LRDSSQALDRGTRDGLIEVREPARSRERTDVRESALPFDRRAVESGNLKTLRPKMKSFQRHLAAFPPGVIRPERLLARRERERALPPTERRR